MDHGSALALRLSVRVETRNAGDGKRAPDDVKPSFCFTNDNTNNRSAWQMATSKLANILKFLTGGEPTPEERQHLVKEALLMTLARASSSDADIAPVEVETVRAIIKRATDEDVSAADVRVAAHSELFETSSLTNCLSRIGRKIGEEDRAMIARSLAEVIRSDLAVTKREVQFFNEVASALQVTPAGLAGLIADSS